jgi:PAS domain S-box-containing protein
MLAGGKNSSYREMFLRHPQPMFVYEIGTLRFLDVNDAACRDYGYTRERFLQMTILEIRPEADRARAVAYVNDLGEAPAGTTLWRHLRADGSVFYVDVTSNALRIGKKSARIALAIDATARLAVSRALSDSRAALGEAQELAHLGSFETDLITGEMRWSAELYRICGVDPARERPVLLYEFDHPDDRQEIAAAVARAREEGGCFTIEHRIRTRDGRERHVFERGRYFYENGRPSRVVGAILDITDRKYAEERLRHLAEHDSLTELPNRTLIRIQLAAAIERASAGGTQLGVLFVDLDRFKTINDTIAHAAGDDVLREIGGACPPRSKPRHGGTTRRRRVHHHRLGLARRNDRGRDRVRTARGDLRTDRLRGRAADRHRERGPGAVSARRYDDRRTAAQRR